jgi:hypothetical protein
MHLYFFFRHKIHPHPWIQTQVKIVDDSARGETLDSYPPERYIGTRPAHLIFYIRWQKKKGIYVCQSSQLGTGTSSGLIVWLSLKRERKM